MLIDPQKIILQSPPGTAIYASVFRPEQHIDFLIREESKIIQNRLKNPIITVRPGLLIQNNIAVVVVMFQLGSEPEQIFETWWNYYQKEGGKYFRGMAIQDNIAFHLYGDTKKVEKSIQIPNSLQGFFQQIEEIKELPPWSMQEFDEERERIYQQYPTPSALWDALFKAGKGN